MNHVTINWQLESKGGRPHNRRTKGGTESPESASCYPAVFLKKSSDKRSVALSVSVKDENKLAVGADIKIYHRSNESKGQTW